MKRDFVDLFEFQTRMKEGIECLFPSRFWLRAEISAVKARPGGHCYLELSQSNDEGLTAKASAAIWSSKYRFIAPYFESVTGSPINEGMTVLVHVQATYSQIYGFTLVIDDIDPEYSLGQKEMERRRTVARLKEEGLMDLQKGLEFPALPYRFAVISAEDAAGYRDFMRHLHENPYGFTFCTDLFPALMQGSGCPGSIVAALDSVMDAGEDYDAVLILRGGGSKLDLSCYDDYGLASVIAQFPLPVLTAVGHDQDFHVCDMVAHTYVKTPTALADEIIAIYEDEDARLSSFALRMKMAFSGRISDAMGTIAILHSKIKSSFFLKISGMESAVEVLRTRIEAADPERVLERGYALALGPDGAVMKGVSSVVPGDRVGVMFADGTLRCRVEDIEYK
ncbi:MAG: exodeoxyribonuclease VII large subunit [Candidatus Cryptobacteroides sp.]